MLDHKSNSLKYSNTIIIDYSNIMIVVVVVEYNNIIVESY